MSKYRIVKSAFGRAEYYYVQRKRWYGWEDVKKWKGDHCGGHYEPQVFDTLSEAMSFVEGKIFDGQRPTIEAVETVVWEQT